jgi:hypothetical protein
MDVSARATRFTSVCTFHGEGPFWDDANLRLLREGRLTVVLDHDLRQDMRRACMMVMGAHGAAGVLPPPGLSKVESLQRAQLELNTYRDQMGPRIAKDDPSVAYLTDIARQIEREQRRIEREAAAKKRAAAAGESK